jgi:inosine-uridine nucleoside N-ribohydrolase
MVGLDVTHKALITRAHTEQLRRSGRVGEMVAQLLDFYLRFHDTMYPELDGAPMHDPVALAGVVRPELLETRPAEIDVDCGWEQGRGRTNVDWRGREDASFNAKAAVDVDSRGFVDLLLERIASLG